MDFAVFFWDHSILYALVWEETFSRKETQTWAISGREILIEVCLQIDIDKI